VRVGQKFVVVLIWRPESWQMLTGSDVGLLDFLRNRGSSSELSAEVTVGTLLGYLSEPRRFERLLQATPPEPPRVRAMLETFGQQLSQAESSRPSALRKSLNLLWFDLGSRTVDLHALPCP